MKQLTSWMGALCLLASLVLSVEAHGPLHERLEKVAIRISEAPLDSTLYLERALLQQEHGDLEAARADLDRALVLNSTDLVIRATLASILLEIGEIDGALDLARAVIKEDPEHYSALLVEARALVLTGKTEAAIAAFDRLIANGPPPSPDLILERFRTVRIAHPTNSRRALLGLEAGIARVGPLVALLLPAIEIERKTGMTDAALRRVALLREQAGRPTPWIVLEAEILSEAGRVTEAVARAQDALRRL